MSRDSVRVEDVRCATRWCHERQKSKKTLLVFTQGERDRVKVPGIRCLKWARFRFELKGFDGWRCVVRSALFFAVVATCAFVIVDCARGNCKISNEGMNKDRTENLNMRVCVRTINGKTVGIKCDRKQTAARILETVERRTLIPRDLMYLVSQGKVLKDNKTKEENNIEAGASMEMSLRLKGEREEPMDTSETEEDFKKEEAEITE